MSEKRVQSVEDLLMLARPGRGRWRLAEDVVRQIDDSWVRCSGMQRFEDVATAEGSPANRYSALLEGVRSHLSRSMKRPECLEVGRFVVAVMAIFRERHFPTNEIEELLQRLWAESGVLE